MRSTSHITAGTIITAIIASLFSINIFDSIGSLLTAMFFSVFPDIDHTHSLLGRLLRPVSTLLVRRYGHRTITHSILFFIPISYVISLFNRELAIIVFISLLIHSLLDASTLNGVMLFYPISKRICVVPGNPDYRIKTGSRSEIITVILFIVLGIALKPLYSNGFWDTLRLKISPFEKISDNILQSVNNTFTVDYSSNGVRQTLKVVSLAGDKKKLHCLDIDSNRVVTIFDDSTITTVHSITDIDFAEVKVSSSFSLDSIYKPHHQIIIKSDSPISLTYFSNDFNHKVNDYQFNLWNAHVVELVFTKLDKKQKELLKNTRNLNIVNDSISLNNQQLKFLKEDKDNLLIKRSKLESNFYQSDEKLSLINNEIKTTESTLKKLKTESVNLTLLIQQLKTELDALTPNVTVQAVNYKLITK